MLAANLITFVALCVTALTVYLNWRSGNRRLDLDESQFKDRLRHERVQHARGIAASTYARAWRLGESYRQSNAERLWVTSGGDPDVVKKLYDRGLSWEEFNSVREEVLALSVLGWTPEIRHKANVVGDALIEQRQAAWAALTTTEAETRRKAFDDVGRKNQTTAQYLNNLANLLAE
ncbi:MAG: hypothetical protein M5U23_13105 [Acidimicrobiia bacterium]|nr:hypothetical protein [Acidimicrobiia bacterium]